MTFPLRLLCCCSILLWVGCGGSDGENTGSDHPSARGVVLFTVDTLRADRLGAYGNRAFPTPNVDRLAKEALVFDMAYSQGCNTNPSVTSFLTGLLPPRHGVLTQVARMKPEVITLPVMLSAQGVATGSFVANLCELQEVSHSVFNEGWDERFCGMEDGVPQYAWDKAVVDAGMAWIKKAQGEDAPWFAWVHLMDPHSEYNPSPDFWDHEESPVRPKTPQLRFFSGFEETRDTPPPPVLKRLDALYAAEVKGADQQLGRFLDFLDTLPGNEDVALIFGADHGEELYETWHRIGHGFSMTEGVLKVPLMIRSGGVSPGRNDELVETLSITPTVLGMLGTRPPYPLDGESLLGPSPALPFARSFESGLAMTLRTATHRYWQRTVDEPPRRETANWRLEAPWFEQAQCLATYGKMAPNQPQWLDLDDPAQSKLLKRMQNSTQALLDQTLGLDPITDEIDDEGYLDQLRELGYL